MRPNNKTRILLVDDHPIVCTGLRYLIELETDLTVCGIGIDVPSALEVFDAEKPDLAIVDISLPGRDGIFLIEVLHKRDAHLPILVVSQHPESKYAPFAIRAGAKGYITKEQVPETIVKAICTVLRGGVHLSESMKTELLMEFIDGSPKRDENPVKRLSPREFEVFRLIGEGLSTRQIAEQFNLSLKTVDVYRWRIKEKLKLSGINQLVSYASLWDQKKN